MAENPYSPRVLQLSAKLAELENAPVPAMFTPEEIVLRKALQAREEQLAVLAKLSGDKVLAPVGTALLPEALRKASPRYTEHGEFDPLTGRHSIFPEYTRRRELERLQRDLTSAEIKEAAAEQANATLQQKQDFARPYMDALADYRRQKTAEDARRAAEGKPLQGQALKNLEQLGKDVDSLNEVKRQFKDNFSALNSAGISPVGAAQDYITSKAPAFVPDQWEKNRLAWGTLQRLKEIKDRHAAFGATLTTNEKISWDQVTPPRGATRAQLDTWLDQQENLLMRAVRASASAAAAAGGHKRQIEELTRGVWKAPEPSNVPISSDADFIYVPGQGTTPNGR